MRPERTKRASLMRSERAGLGAYGQRQERLTGATVPCEGLGCSVKWSQESQLCRMAGSAGCPARIHVPELSPKRATITKTATRCQVEVAGEFLSLSASEKGETGKSGQQTLAECF